MAPRVPQHQRVAASPEDGGRPPGSQPRPGERGCGHCPGGDGQTDGGMDGRAAELQRPLPPAARGSVASLGERDTAAGGRGRRPSPHLAPQPGAAGEDPQG